MNAANRHSAVGMKKSRLFMVQDEEIVDACRLGVKLRVGAVGHSGRAPTGKRDVTRDLRWIPGVFVNLAEVR
jgi:hypothetical protein